MRHRVLSTRLKRTSSELRALLTNQTKQLIVRGSVTTTLTKAKLLRPFAEKTITLAKEKSFNAVKRIKSVLRDDDVTRVLFDEVAPKFANRLGGYTRVVKLGNRVGDAAPMGRIEFVEVVSPKLHKIDNNQPIGKEKKSVGKVSSSKVQKKSQTTKSDKPATNKEKAI